MLNVYRCIYVDAGPQQLLHILIALAVAAALGVGVGKLVNQDELRCAFDRAIQIEFMQGDALMADRERRQLL